MEVASLSRKMQSATLQISVEESVEGCEFKVMTSPKWDLLETPVSELTGAYGSAADVFVPDNKVNCQEHIHLTCCSEDMRNISLTKYQDIYDKRTKSYFRDWQACVERYHINYNHLWWLSGNANRKKVETGLCSFQRNPNIMEMCNYHNVCRAKYLCFCLWEQFPFRPCVWAIFYLVPCCSVSNY